MPGQGQRPALTFPVAVVDHHLKARDIYDFAHGMQNVFGAVTQDQYDAIQAGGQGGIQYPFDKIAPFYSQELLGLPNLFDIPAARIIPAVGFFSIIGLFICLIRVSSESKVLGCKHW